MTTYIIEETLGQRIRAQRMRMGWTQEELAEKMCVPKSTISAYENDRVDIKSSVIVELSNLLETTPNHLLGIGGDPYAEKVSSLVCSIKDEKIRALLLAQIEAAANIG